MNTIPPISSLWDPRNVLTLAAFGGLALLSWLAMTSPSAKLKRPLITALLLLVLPFLPASNLFFPVGFVVAERVLYTPSMGFCMLVALGAWQLRKYSSSLLKVCVMSLALMHSAKTLARNRDWHSSRALFQSAVTVSPTNGKMWSNWGAQISDRGNKSLAIEMFKQSIRVEPLFVTAYSNLAYTLREVREMRAALQV